MTIPVALAGLAVLLGPTGTSPGIVRRTCELMPFAALTLAYFVFIYVQEYRSTSEEGLYRFGWHVWANLWDYLKWITLPLPDDWASWVSRARPFTAVAFLVTGAVSITLRSRVLGFAFGWTLLALLPYSFFPAGIEWRYTYLASVPFAVFTAVVGRTVLCWFRARWASRVIMPAAAAALLLLVVFLGGQARDRQAWISHQARAYDDLFHQAPLLCGELPRESHVYLLHSPIFDLFGASARMALNLHYEDVYVDRAGGDEIPELAVFIENKCVLDYDAQMREYVRVE